MGPLKLHWQAVSRPSLGKQCGRWSCWTANGCRASCQRSVPCTPGHRSSFPARQPESTQSDRSGKIPGPVCTFLESLMYWRLTWVALSSPSSRLFSHTLFTTKPFLIIWTWANVTNTMTELDRVTSSNSCCVSRHTAVNAAPWFSYFVVDAHAHLYVRVDCVGEGVDTSFGGSEDSWGRRQTSQNHITLDRTVLKSIFTSIVLWFWPNDGLYPAASFRVTVL